MEPQIDPRRCPLCSGPNDCGRAQGRSTCWCFGASIAREVLERIPADAQNRTCICRGCAAGEVLLGDGPSPSKESPT